MAENTPTPNYNFNLPLVGGDDDVWGDLLNENWSSIDTILWTVSGVASAALTPITGDARYLRLTGGTVGPNSLIVNGPASLTNYTQVTGQFVSSGGATFGTAQVFFNSQVTFSADALMVTPAPADNSQRAATTAWVTAALGSRGFITDAPNDGHQYARQSQAWAQIAPSGVPEAPTDGRQYARQNAAWTPFVSGPPTTISDTPPASPSVGQLWWDSVGAQLYVWYQDANSSQWVVAVNAASRPPPASTTTLGSVKVDGTSIQAAPDGTISTVLVPMGDNRIINGDMRIDQRNSGNPGTASNAYTIDRWAYAASQVTKGTWQRVGGAPSGFGYSLIFTSSSAYTSVAADYFAFQQPIEADMVVDFAWGTAGAQPVTLSFLVETSQSGTFSGSIRNAAQTRSYPFSFNVPSAGTWTKIVVTIPGDTSGSWTLSGNGEALRVCFDLGSGSSNRGPANAWATTAAPGYLGVTGAVSTVATNGAYFVVTGVKLEIGSVVTPFNRQSLAKSLADCQRYYQTGNWGLGGYSTVGIANYTQSPLPVLMRATPTVTYTLNTPGNISTASPTVVGAATLAINTTVAANGGFSANGTYTLSAEL